MRTAKSLTAESPSRDCNERSTHGTTWRQRASAATPPTLNLNVLLIGGATTAAWQSALSSEGVAYTLVTPSGAYVPRR